MKNVLIVHSATYSEQAIENDYDPLELHQLLYIYASSKQLRLGTAYLESEWQDKIRLSFSTGITLEVLRKYAGIVLNYWPCEMPEYNAWTDKEDNFLMERYQRMTLSKVCKALPNRSRSAIIKRAMYLGVTKIR